MSKFTKEPHIIMYSQHRRTWAVLLAGILGLNCKVSPRTQVATRDDTPPEASIPFHSDDSASSFDGGFSFEPFDAGLPPYVPVDAGTEEYPDAGTPDGGLSTYTPPQIPSVDGWQFFGPQNGGPKEVFGVSSDASGNIWVAGGNEGVFLLTPGATEFKRFTISDGLTPFMELNALPAQQKVLSVGGAQANVVYVGYEGHFGTENLNDPPYLLKSGDVDRLEWNGATLTVRHLDLSTGPGVSEYYPQGRDLIRSVYRILYHPKTQDVWFGGNHGVAMWNAFERRTIEHVHAAIYGYNNSGARTMLSGDWYGVGIDSAGDIWMGGGHRSARLQYGTEDLNFWAALDPIVDVWPDAMPSDAPPNMRTDDYIQDLVVLGDSVVVGSIPNGLARIEKDGGVSNISSSGLVDAKVTALERDPQDGSLWVGHIWGGITRLQGGARVGLSDGTFGSDLISGEIPDIQSDMVNGNRRILVAFRRGAIGIYTGR